MRSRWRTALRIIDDENCMPSHCCTLSGLEGNLVRVRVRVRERVRVRADPYLT